MASALGALGLLFGVLARISVTRMIGETRPAIRSSISVPFLGIELSTMVAFMLVGVWAGNLPEAPNAMVVGYLALAWASVVLTVIDLRTNRLPNVIVYPTVVVLALSVFFAALDSQQPWGRGLAAFATACVVTGCYAALWMLGGLGLGDVKLSLALGLALGWSGWLAALVGMLAAFALSGSFALLALTKRSARATTRIPFGPWMFLGAWIGLCVTELVSP